MNVSTRAHFDGARQRAVLTELERQSGLGITALASAVGLSYNQYLRYARGKTPLRYDQFEVFAAAYGVEPNVLTENLGLSVSPPAQTDARILLCYVCGYVILDSSRAGSAEMATQTTAENYCTITVINNRLAPRTPITLIANIAFERTDARALVKARGYAWRSARKHWALANLTADRARDEVVALFAAGFRLAGDPSEILRQSATLRLTSDVPVAFFGIQPVVDGYALDGRVFETQPKAEHWQDGTLLASSLA